VFWVTLTVPFSRVMQSKDRYIIIQGMVWVEIGPPFGSRCKKGSWFVGPGHLEGRGGNEKRHIDCRKVQERKVLAMRSAVSISKIPLRPFAFSKGANGEKLGCPLSSYCWGEAPTQIAFLTSRFI
jgi:hypothetical protein